MSFAFAKTSSPTVEKKVKQAQGSGRQVKDELL